jgi:hypothetical protein
MLFFSYVVRVGDSASVAYAAATFRPGRLFKNFLMRPGCAPHAWLTLCTIFSSRGLT